MSSLAAPSSQLDLALECIGECYGSLRLISPAAEKQMLSSVARFGQLSPVVVNLDPDAHYELIDGFKRLRAMRKLERPTLKARVITVGAQAARAALLQFNWTGKSVTELEEALVVQALHREDGLQQQQIAALLARHKSWVSRRLSLVERLTGEVQEALRLGLLTASSGRELAKLPRGNQAAALDAVQQHRLSFRETGCLVSELLAAPRWEQAAILRCEAIVAQRLAPVRQPSRASNTAGLKSRLLSMSRVCQAVAEEKNAAPGEELARLIKQAIGAAVAAIINLKALAIPF
jgi:ParB/RepB/Spo0J family partition protein